MIEVIKEDWVPDFKHATQYSAGYDLYCKNKMYIKPMEIVKIDTGIRVNMMNDVNCMGLIFPRSGLSSKSNLRLCNSVGLVDQDYHGPLIVCLQNIGKEEEFLPELARVAQIVFCYHNNNSIDFVKSFNTTTKRGDGGFGSTGV